jgi:hypothetical protein
MQAYIRDCTREAPVIFETYTIESSKANDFAAGIAKEFIKTLEWVEIGEFYPVVFNNALHYTFTVRGGTFI